MNWCMRHGTIAVQRRAPLAQSVWFFIPFLWWLRVQLRTDQEYLTDYRTAQIAGSAPGYAARLVILSRSRAALVFFVVL